MGMSSRVRGFVPPDQQWEKMKAIYDACEVAGISIPPEVSKFFDHAPPDDAGVEVKIDFTERSDSNNCADIFEVNISDIPKNVKIIRFTNSY